jgi:hypothetical protein
MKTVKEAHATLLYPPSFRPFGSKRKIFAALMHHEPARCRQNGKAVLMKASNLSSAAYVYNNLCIGHSCTWAVRYPPQYFYYSVYFSVTKIPRIFSLGVEGTRVKGEAA